jgi:hypothetical protein
MNGELMDLPWNQLSGWKIHHFLLMFPARKTSILFRGFVAMCLIILITKG